MTFFIVINKINKKKSLKQNVLIKENKNVNIPSFKLLKKSYFIKKVILNFGSNCKNNRIVLLILNSKMTI
jgi:MinD superfamily P-loop ATPase